MMPPATLPSQLHGRWEELASELGSLSPGDAKDLERYIMLCWEYDAITPKIIAAITRGDSADAAVWIGSQEKLTRQIKPISSRLRLDRHASDARKLPKIK